VALGLVCLFPPLSSGGAPITSPLLRFHTPLIEPDMQISRIRLSDRTSRLRTRQVTTKDPVDERDRSARRGARVDSSRPCDA
jgi:hypothetical protein